MDLDLSGKNAFVCGASRGIGRASAHELASLGASVTLVARNRTGLQDVLQSLARAQGQTHHMITADFNDLAAMKALVEAHIKDHGPQHILLNNTGGPPAGPVQDATPDQFERCFAQHLLCSHLLAQAVLPGMKDARYGRIINIISTSVKVPVAGLGVSNTVRAAVANWAKTLAGEVARFGITVNNVLPGATDTDRMAEIIQGKAAKLGKSLEDVAAHEIAAIPAGRFGRADEPAAAVGFLASPAASYITGINLPVDGGRTGSL